MRENTAKFITLIFLCVLCSFACFFVGMSVHQALSVGIFLMSIMGTLFFWQFRLSFVFLGTALLLVTKSINLDQFLSMTSLEVILFLAGMMIVVSLLKDSGFFAWLVVLILRVKKLTGKKFTLLVIIFSAVLACVVDEVTSIIFMVAAILEICDYYEVNPMPFVIISILATNIGSAATVLGNPIGIVIATKTGLGFEDFLSKALPLAVVSLIVTIGIVMFWFAKPIRDFDRQAKEFQANEILLRLIAVPMDLQLKRGLAIFSFMIIFIAFHRPLELLLGLSSNTMLLIMPIITAGFIMIWKSNKARMYVEKGIEWWTLLFFLFLFGQAGTLRYIGVTDFFAAELIKFAQHSSGILLTFVLWSSSIGSSMLDNVIVVVAYEPIVKSFISMGFGSQSFWWALLLGGCLGGNITLIGSTANIVALGILEKEKNIRIRFRDWIGIGASVGIGTTFIVWLMLTFLPLYK
ncbi:MAG: SLC13 family permease [Candidatus Omnitrophota bacterium]